MADDASAFDVYSKILEDFANASGFDINTVAEMIDEYLAILPGMVEKLYEEMKNDINLEALRQAHTIKGSAGNLRMFKTAEAALEIENALKASETGLAIELADRLRRNVAKTNESKDMYRK